MQIEMSDAVTESYYILPDAVQEIDDELFVQDEIILAESRAQLTLLNAVQADMLVLRNPEDTPVCNLSHLDDSIQLHQAPTRRREVQILYHNLLRIIERHPDVHPSDMIVMAPQVSDYVPYIKAIFGSNQSQLDYQLLDLGMQNSNEIVQGFLQLIALSASRWNVNDLLQLFENRAFQRHHQISSSDFQAIKKWIESTGIHWGDDSEHRDELMLRRHCKNGMAEKTSIGTWDHGLNRLMLGLTTLLDEAQETEFDLLPCGSVDFSQVELLSKWIRLIHSLRDDLSPLNDGSKITMGDWSKYLECLLESYFQCDYESGESANDFEDLKQQFELLRLSALSCDEAVYPFCSVNIHLNELLEQRGITYRENHVQAVRFCSLMPLRSIPAKVIAILGMEEGGFPRQNQYSSLNLLSGEKECDYCPLPTDYDRYLFLEPIHSAQQCLLISYQGYSSKDQKELHPCLVAAELFAYLDKYYTLLGQKVSQVCQFKHPFDAFHTSYFQKDSPYPNYSLHDYQTALVNSHIKAAPHAFLRQFDPPVNVFSESEIEVVDLKHLSALVRNPLKFYLNKGMGVYLENGEDREIKTEEGLTLTPLQKFQMKESAVKESIDSLLQHAEKTGKMPLGLFKTVAQQKMQEEKELIVAALKKHNINEDEIFQIEFSQGCQEPFLKAENHWTVPSLIIESEGKKHVVVGKIPYVCPQGMISPTKGSIEEMWKLWPQFLLFNYAAGRLPNPVERQILPLHAAKTKKTFFVDPIPYLKTFLNYYEISLRQVSPLLPEWISSISKEDVKGLRKKMEGSFGQFQKSEINWILNKTDLPHPEKIIRDWKPMLDLLAKSCEF